MENVCYDTRNFDLIVRFFLVFFCFVANAAAQLKFNEVWKKLNRRLTLYFTEPKIYLISFSCVLVWVLFFVFKYHSGPTNGLNQSHIFHLDLRILVLLWQEIKTGITMKYCGF